MKTYETLHLVKSEDLNHHGTLFAARAAEWLIEAGFAVAACEHGNPDEVVLRNLQNMSFSRPIKKGSVVKFTGRVVDVGTTSFMVAVTVSDAISGEEAVEGFITFVTIDKVTGNKKPHHIVPDETSDAMELQLRAKAQQIRGSR